MRSILLIFQLLATNLNAFILPPDHTNFSVNATNNRQQVADYYSYSVSSAIMTPEFMEQTKSTPKPANISMELSNVSKSCITRKEHEELLKNTLDAEFVQTVITPQLLPLSGEMIGLGELRRCLGFASLGPWKEYNYTDPSKDELDSAPSLEAYYELKEPTSIFRSLGIGLFSEQIFPRAIAFLDKRFAIVRNAFKWGYEEIRGVGEVDRKMIDDMITEYGRINEKVREAVKAAASNDCQ